jgi:hypothetical protein
MATKVIGATAFAWGPGGLPGPIRAVTIDVDIDETLATPAPSVTGSVSTSVLK